MAKHIILLLLITTTITGCIFLPFMAGDYDSFSVTLSAILQLAVITSLLLVPVGIIWLIYERGRSRRSYQFAGISIVISAIIILAAALGAFISHAVSMAFVILIAGVYIIGQLLAGRRRMKRTPEKRRVFLPVYLIAIPLTVMCFRWFLLEDAVAFSRNRVIQQSEVLIHDIETYHEKNGHYPSSLLSIWEDYKPGVKCIRRYQYELNGSAYNLFFEQFSNHLTIKEIVMYNKLNEQEMTSHNQDLLLLSPAALNVQRGYFTSKQLPQPHWKYFWFD